MSMLSNSNAGIGRARRGGVSRRQGDATGTALHAKANELQIPAHEKDVYGRSHGLQEL